MKALIVTGGNTNINFLKEHLLQEKFDKIIAVDKGLEALSQINEEPNYIIGDFDSVNINVLNRYKDIPIEYLKPEKDFTDTHMGLKLAIKEGARHITIIGATGARIDHLLANIHIIKEALEQGIYVELVDLNNKITLLNKDTTIKLDKKYKYISLVPLTSEVTGLSLEGFKYNLNNFILKTGDSICISNEQISEKATIKIMSGIVIFISSKD